MLAMSPSESPIKPGLGPWCPRCHICMDRKKPNKTGPRSMVSTLSRSRAYRQNTVARYGAVAGSSDTRNYSDFKITLDCMDTVDRGPTYKGFSRSTQMWHLGHRGPRPK
jgi:hypothetical protein